MRRSAGAPPPLGDLTRVLVTGAAGQLGVQVMRARWPRSVEVVGVDRAGLDLADVEIVESFLRENLISAIINCAAYTAVDMAEAEPALAFHANALVPAVLAQATSTLKIPLLHVSTDYVFDGQSQTPYVEDDRTSPLGVYGASKLAGELAVTAGNPRSVIVRTAWVVSPSGSNFLKTMLRLAADRNRVRVVGDQWGCPTSASDLAAALVTIIERLVNDAGTPTGVYNFVNGGQANWAGLATEIFARSRGLGGPWAAVDEIGTNDYPTKARRPQCSVLSTAKITVDYGISPRPWREAILDILENLSVGSEQ
ncbi:dTDP-4-dehydrorhamnose reductase [soil metagenome]